MSYQNNKNDKLMLKNKKENPIWEIFVPLFFLLFFISLFFIFPCQDTLICDASGKCTYSQSNIIRFPLSQEYFEKALINNMLIEIQENNYTTKQRYRTTIIYKVQMTNGKTFVVPKNVFKILEEYKDSDENTLTYSSYRPALFLAVFFVLSFPLFFLFITSKRIYNTRIKNRR